MPRYISRRYISRRSWLALVVLAVSAAALVVHPVVSCRATADGQRDVERPDANDASAQWCRAARPRTRPPPQCRGQDAFGAIQEIVRILEADPKTDWSKVNLEALRQHLIDMSEVTLKADAVTKPIDGGIEVTVTGTGRTVEAIQRMVPAQAHQVDQTSS